MGDDEVLRTFLSTPLEEHLSGHEGLDAGARAVALFQRAAREVPAYRAFLAAEGVEPAAVTDAAALARVPTVSKDGYLRQHTLPALCFGGTLAGSETVAVSSGSTGLPTYFPRSLRHEVEVAWRFEQVFRDSFAAHARTTLAVVCFPLGTWVGGMFTAACSRLLAQKGYRLLVVTPGNQPPEIWRAVQELGPFHEQIVLLGYPPFLKSVIDGGRASGIDWAARPLRLVLAGEVVSEAWRDIMLERTGTPDEASFSCSLYGTADAGVLGVETALCTGIRRLCAERGEVAEALFGQRRLPTLAQYDPVERYFEAEGTELVLTAEGGGIPLCRYALGDRGGVIDFDAMRARLAGHALDWERARRLPFVFVFGRAEHAVSFFGANVFVEVVRLGLEHRSVREAVTGKLVMEVREDEAGDSHLRVDVELARGVVEDEALGPRIAAEIRAALVSTGGEFAAYVPAPQQLPEVRLWPHGHPEHFPVGVKHQYLRR